MQRRSGAKAAELGACLRRTARVASSVLGGSCIDSRKKTSGSAWPKARTFFVYSSHSGAISAATAVEAEVAVQAEVLSCCGAGHASGWGGGGPRSSSHC
jgi:hypothetical protein